MMDFDGGMGGSAWLLMTVVWVLLIGAVVWAVASLFPARGGRTEGVPQRPEEILDQRFARGDIDSSTYDELRAKLRAARAERV